MITGPNGPFTNIPPAIETHVDFIGDAIAKAEKDAAPIVEATAEAERDWTQLCVDMSKDSLFKRTDSWIFGANVEGKKVRFLFYSLFLYLSLSFSLSLSFFLSEFQIGGHGSGICTSKLRNLS